MGNIFQGMGEAEKSHKYFSQALSVDQGSIVANYGIGKLYYDFNWLDQDKYQPDG